MSKLNKYQKQLSQAIETTRNKLLTELNEAQAASTTALSARDHAAHDKWSAYKEMGRNEQVLTVASRVEAMAARAQLLAGNLTHFANDSHSDSEKAQAAMAEAAAAIKNAASTMNILNEAVHAESAVTNIRDTKLDVNDDAQVAAKAVNSAMYAVDNLQNQSLKCSIIAATPLAGSVAQSFSVLGDQVGNLVTDTTQARDAARQEVAATTTLRNQTWKRFYKTIEPFERPLQAKNGLLRSFKEIDKLANFDLQVWPSNQATTSAPGSAVDQKGMAAGFMARVALPVETVELYQPPVFYAVSEPDAATFNFATSSFGVQLSAKQMPPDLEGRHVWEKLLPQIAPDSTAPATSDITRQTIEKLVAQAGKHAQAVTDQMKQSAQQAADAYAKATAKAEKHAKSVDTARTVQTDALKIEDALKKALAEAQQKQDTANAAVENARSSSEDKDKKSVPKALLKALADAEADAAKAAEELAVAQIACSAADANLAQMEKESAQATTELITAERWQAACDALARAQAAFETAATNTKAAHKAVKAAKTAEEAAEAAEKKASEASHALSASAGSNGKLELEQSKAEQASSAAVAKFEKAGLEAAQALARLNETAANAEAEALAAAQEVIAAETATTTTVISTTLSNDLEEMKKAAASAASLAKDINTKAQAEKQLETQAITGFCQAQLLKDNKGEPLRFGTSYCIFMKQDLKPGIPPSPLAQLPRFSLPSQPILATYSLHAPLTPTVLRLKCGQSEGPDDPLLVAFTLPTPPPQGVNYRMVVIPSKLWENRKEDEEYLIERASPSDYVELDFTALASPPIDIHARRIQAIQDHILNHFTTDLKSLLPSKDHSMALQAAKDQVEPLLKPLTDTTHLQCTALVYYSSVPNSPSSTTAKDNKPQFTQFGYYSDMSGDVITLNNDCYTFGVLAWQNNPDGPYVGSLVGKSGSIGTPPPYFYGSAPADDPTAAPPAPAAAAAATTPAA